MADNKPVLEKEAKDFAVGMAVYSSASILGPLIIFGVIGYFLGKAYHGRNLILLTTTATTLFLIIMMAAPPIMRQFWCSFVFRQGCPVSSLPWRQMQLSAAKGPGLDSTYLRISS